MGENEQKRKKQKHKHSSDPGAFNRSSDVKGIRFGSQFIVKSFTVRRASSPQLSRLLRLAPSSDHPLLFPSTTAFIPTNFTILAHHAWHTLTLGLGTKNSKVVVFVFESENMKLSVDPFWPSEIPLGEVNRKLVRGLNGCEIARFKFRKGCITFYVFAVRKVNAIGFSRAEDLRLVLQSVASLKDFLDHTAMLALPNQRAINYSSQQAAMAH
ncbi:hypothetical protein MKW94_027256 [Papaver nudicaule]|uniref:DUF7851 domain-containing protein n=1 Tax=Papaver nudicaule TaxID=74823 RepID=A0AA41V1R1_PAPNU|nr:hypothetical protein [Papaver nudicaule]